MTEQQMRLTRTSLKYFGLYLLSGDSPSPYVQEHDESEEAMISSAYAELEQLLKSDIHSSKKILEAATHLGAAYQWAGFLSGIKVGARLLLNLTDSRDIMF